MAEATFWNLLNGALGLEPEVFRQAEALPTGLRTALLVMLLAGVSTALGQSAVLFINRIRIERFAASLTVAAVIFAFTYLFWTTSTLLIARYVFHSAAPWRGVAIAVGLGYAPRVFGFLVFTPFFGVPVFVLLSLWSLLAILTGVGGVLGLPEWASNFVQRAGVAGVAAVRANRGTPGGRRSPLAQAASSRRRGGDRLARTGSADGLRPDFRSRIRYPKARARSVTRRTERGRARC